MYGCCVALLSLFRLIELILLWWNAKREGVPSAVLTLERGPRAGPAGHWDIWSSYFHSNTSLVHTHRVCVCVCAAWIVFIRLLLYSSFLLFSILFSSRVRKALGGQAANIRDRWAEDTGTSLHSSPPVCYLVGQRSQSMYIHSPCLLEWQSIRGPCSDYGKTFIFLFFPYFPMAGNNIQCNQVKRDQNHNSTMRKIRRLIFCWFISFVLISLGWATPLFFGTFSW